MKKVCITIFFGWFVGSCDLLKDRCEEDSAVDCDKADTDADADADSDADVDADADVDLIDDADLHFSITRHPCSGNRTDALWIDDVDTAWVGCGTTTTGTGLYRTVDGGDEWNQVDGFEDFRVNHLWRGAVGGALFVSGNSTVDDRRVVAYDGSADDVWTNGSTSEMSFSVGSFAVSDDGVEVAESLTGNGVVIGNGSGGWLSGYGWWNRVGSSAVQIMDLDVASGSVVGVGNIISEPPVVYLPPRDWRFGDVDEPGERATGLWEIVELTGGTAPILGEAWDIDGDRNGLVVGGVNQEVGSGTVWTVGPEWPSDAYDSSKWTFTDASDVALRDSPTWIRGVCRKGKRVAAVGEYSALGDGLVLLSQDGGRTFADRTDEVLERLESGWNLGPLHRCQFTATGELFVAGASGVFIRHTL